MTLRVTFLGTSGSIPTTDRNTSAMLVNRDGDRLLFDAGEGTQRQMMRFGTGFSISDVFVTHLHGDHVLGLPGLIQTWSFNDRTEPLTIHTPVGTGPSLESMLFALKERPTYPFEINEVRHNEVALRAAEYEVRTFRTDHRTRSVGYAIIEDDHKGRFDRTKAEELGVPVGPMFSALHDGHTIELEDGTIVHPDQVVGPPRPGRKIVYTGDTRPMEGTVTISTGADLLIHDATFASDWADRARETAHSTAAEAAMIADRADVSRLALTHISSRYAGNAAELENEAIARFDGETFLARDGMRLEIPYPE